MNRLLIIDDALIMRMKIREIARSAGWIVVAEATNGEEAVKLFEEHRPDLVTLDMVMPGMDGPRRPQSDTPIATRRQYCHGERCQPEREVAGMHRKWCNRLRGEAVQSSESQSVLRTVSAKRLKYGQLHRCRRR